MYNDWVVVRLKTFPKRKKTKLKDYGWRWEKRRAEQWRSIRLIAIEHLLPNVEVTRDEFIRKDTKKKHGTPASAIITFIYNFISYSS